MKVFSLFSLITFSFLLVGCGGSSSNDDNSKSGGGSNNTTSINTTLSSNKDITKFWFATGGVKDAEIYTDNNNTNVIDVAIEYNPLDTTPQVSHTGVSYSPVNTPIDFASLPANYTVTAQDNTTKSYDVTVRRAFVVSDATELKNAIGNVTKDIADNKSISYITIFVANDINLTNNVTIPSTWAGRNIRLENNNSDPYDTVTIRDLKIQGDNSTVKRIRVDLAYSSCLPSICTNYDFNNTIRNNPNGNYTLENDIDLSDYPDWEPIGDADRPFTGTFNGNGHKISGLTFGNSSAKYTGLFGYIRGAEIKNLTVEVVNNSPVELSAYGVADQSFGVLVGYANASTISRVTVSSSPDTPFRIIRSGFGSANTCDLYVGGIVGYIDGAYFNKVRSVLIEESASLITLNATNAVSCNNHWAYVGGIAGYNLYASIENSYASGDISATGKLAFAGGIVGYISGNIQNGHGDVSRSYASGAIFAYSDNQARAGGIAGGTYGGAISYSAALNPSVEARAIDIKTVINAFAKRIASDHLKSTYANNIALYTLDPRENGAQQSPHSNNNNASGEDGLNVGLDDVNTILYTLGGAWDWDNVTKRPVLR
jgi:hypothetical protein